MATPKIIADFETQLNAAIAIGDTSFTIASATDDDGVALPNGLYYFTLENGSTNKEYLAGDLSGTTVSNVVNVSRQGVETSGADRAHRVGSSVIITDFNTYKKYIDETTLVSAPDGDTSTKGVFEAATLAEVRAGTVSGGTGANLAVTPDVLDDLPSADEKTFLTDLEQGNLINKLETFTSSGTWTKDAGLKYIVVEAVAAGGNGGDASAGSSQGAYGGGGGAGGYSKKKILASALGATETVTVGAVGANTTFGTHITCGFGANASDDAAGLGGTASGGDINITGGDGQAGYSGTERSAVAGTGGASFFGGGGAGGADASSSANDGQNGRAYGSGGGGALADNSSSGSGGAGAPGIVIVTEYYS